MRKQVNRPKLSTARDFARALFLRIRLAKIPS